MDNYTQALITALKEYRQSGIYPMHMPGHKQNVDFLCDDLPLWLDITEIDGFDNLHKPSGILADCQLRAARLWKSEHAFYLTTGSTAGILAGIYALAGGGGSSGEILLARNCHKSVYHAIELCGLTPRFIAPPIIEPHAFCGSITAESVENALNNYRNIKLAVITSPTYEGVVSDIEAIAGILHTRNIPLLVDAAHGAHLGFSDAFPKCAIESGADIVIESLHKTLPALTQTAICHIQGKYITPERMQHAISVFQTSSPSYLLMASIDSCVGLLEKSAEELMGQWKSRLLDFYDKTSNLEHLKIIDPRIKIPGILSRDPGKIIISTARAECSGAELMETLLREHKIHLEMAAGRYAIAMTSPCDTTEGMERLTRALRGIDESLSPAPHTSGFSKNIPYPEIKLQRTPTDAMNSKGEFISLDQSIGHISAEYIWAYPPGVPVIIPGQVITGELIEALGDMRDNGVSIDSTYNRFPREIWTVSE